MKMQIKFAAIAVITAIALFACVPEVEITGRDAKEVYAQYSPAQLGNTTVNAPSILSPSFTFPLSDAPAAKELVIRFPVQADVLRKSNSQIEGALKKFLTFHIYTTSATLKPGDTSALDAAPITDYEFVSRAAGLDTTDITIRLKTVPAKNFVARFNQKYTHSNGYKYDFNTSRASSSPIYGDIFQQIFVTGIGVDNTGVGDFIKSEHRGWVLTVGNITNGALPLAAGATQVPVRVFTDYIGFGNSGTDPTELATARKALLDELAGKAKFEVQKWDGSNWVKDAAEIKYLDATTTPVSPGGDGYYALITPVDLTPYRIAATSAANLVTNNVYFGQKQKVSVQSSVLPTAATYYRNTVAGNPGYWYDNTKRFELDFDYYYDGYEVTSDKNGLNVVLKIWVNPIQAGPYTLGTETLTLTDDVWLKDTIDLAAFKKNFKIVGANLAPNITNMTSIESQRTLFFVEIKDVKTGSRTTADKRDELIITLDPSYKYNASSTLYSSRKNIIIGSLDSQLYANDKFTFGDHTNWTYAIDGVTYWKFGTRGGPLDRDFIRF